MEKRQDLFPLARQRGEGELKTRPVLHGKKILLGVSGSIAAYKSAFLVREFIKAGAEVKVILTPAARDFVTPLTLATLSRNPVLWDFFDENDPEGKWNNHVELGLWADILVIAPATSHTLSKMASGAADNLLLGVYLSAKCPVYFAPAMDLDMYRHPSNQNNINKLEEFGNRFIPAGTGELASGLEGEGRMAEPAEIRDFIVQDLKKGQSLGGKKVLVNGGPTHEPLDPVRFLGNRSSGKMGIALAEKASEMGAEVVLVLGPTHLKPQDKSIQLIEIQTAEEMLEKCSDYFGESDIAIFSAAVADYRPEKTASQKIKKETGGLEIKLTKNPDILKTLGQSKTESQVLVGFALETENGIENATQKLHTKNADLIVLNSPTENSGFGTDTNAVTLISRQGEPIYLETKKKEDIAKDILHHIVERFLP